jgi:hypothetical protein
MAMFGWTDPKMPAHYIAKANREKPGMSGMDKIVAFDQSQSLDDFGPLPDANSEGTPGANKVVTLRSNFGKKDAMISARCAWAWCARRAVAFYPSEPCRRVPIKHKGAFRQCPSPDASSRHAGSVVSRAEWPPCFDLVSKRTSPSRCWMAWEIHLIEIQFFGRLVPTGR